MIADVTPVQNVPIRVCEVRPYMSIARGKPEKRYLVLSNLPPYMVYDGYSSFETAQTIAKACLKVFLMDGDERKEWK